ncbi:hypothetical protein L5G32_07105 [Gordonia sp. HY002]|uniref:hypothetical protein n=1 Tax=Gordonia zhenghanii TaxID=2911516 RepID=UPI001EF04991|nr:hypothetical protein [Gordonia zhenghanii]MCF8570033.1 hypothetical protein [Gordonia zhenghanii]MCF8607080.1 hypothetical protein [Gordonia zhenghanii]
MADKSEPESKPITVSELIARSEGDDAFPRSESMSVRRPDRRDTPTTGPTASGMPSYRAPERADDSTGPRTVGASGMPGYAPPTTPRPTPDANAVTGIIPVVPDGPDVERDGVRAAEADDFFDDDLPATEYRRVEADSSSMVQVRRPAESSPFEETAAIPLVDDRVDDDEDAADDVTEAPGDDEVAEDDSDDTDSAGGSKTGKVAGAVGVVSAGVGGSILAGRAARKAKKAERKAARRAGKDRAGHEDAHEKVDDQTADEALAEDGPAARTAPVGAAMADDQPTQSIEPVDADRPVTGKESRTPGSHAAGSHAAGSRAAGSHSEDSSTEDSDTGDSETGDSETGDSETGDGASAKSEPSPVLGWLTFVGELILGLAVGAGLFWGFTELWKRYVYLALILAIVVIFAIVTFAHVLRKRDLPTTLLALGVGMVVTIGPLVLLAAQP